MDSALLFLKRRGLRASVVWSVGHGTGCCVQLLLCTRERRAGHENTLSYKRITVKTTII